MSKMVRYVLGPRGACGPFLGPQSLTLTVLELRGWAKPEEKQRLAASTLDCSCICSFMDGPGWRWQLFASTGSVAGICSTIELVSNAQALADRSVSEVADLDSLDSSSQAGCHDAI